MNDRQRHAEALDVAHTLMLLRLRETLPGEQVALVTIAEIDGDGIHIGFDPDDVAPTRLTTLLRDAADRLDEIAGA